MKLKRPKAVYIQIRQRGKPSRNLTVYDASIDDVNTRLRRALSGTEKKANSEAAATTAA